MSKVRDRNSLSTTLHICEANVSWFMAVESNPSASPYKSVKLKLMGKQAGGKD